MLSDYDVYLISRMLLMKKLRGVRRWQGSRTLAMYFATDFRLRMYYYIVKVKYEQENFLRRLDWWCEYVAGCVPVDVQFFLMQLYLKFVFLSWLPALPEESTLE